MEHLMKILGAAYNGYPMASTISLLLSLQKIAAIALANTRSTTTFMDQEFATRHKIALTTTLPKIVTVAGGGTLISAAMAYNCKFSIQGHAFISDFRILPLHGSDIIFGVHWFKQNSPVTFDFLARELTLGIQGKLHTFQDHLLPKHKILISSE
jgi:hypothetical protein